MNCKNIDSDRLITFLPQDRITNHTLTQFQKRTPPYNSQRRLIIPYKSK